MNAQLQPTGSAYFIAKDETKPEKHTLSVLVDNEPGCWRASSACSPAAATTSRA